MRRLLTLAIPIVLGVGLLAAAVNDPGDTQQTAQRRQDGVTTDSTLPAVIEEPVASTTTTTAAAPAPVPETTTTTMAPTTTTTVRRPTPAAAPRPAPTTTTTVAAPPPPAPGPEYIDCGTGSATAQASFGQVGPNTYRLSAKVVNESTKAIELDSLVVSATYPSGAKSFRVNVAGRRLEAGTSGNSAVFEIPESNSDTPPTRFEIAEFRFHTAGLPECASS